MNLTKLKNSQKWQKIAKFEPWNRENSHTWTLESLKQHPSLNPQVTEFAKLYPLKNEKLKNNEFVGIKITKSQLGRSKVKVELPKNDKNCQKFNSISVNLKENAKTEFTKNDEKEKWIWNWKSPKRQNMSKSNSERAWIRRKMPNRIHKKWLKLPNFNLEIAKS